MIQSYLYQPLKVFWFSLFFILISLLLNGSFMRLYSLSRDQVTIAEQISLLKKQITELDVQVRKAKDPAYITRQALDNYDFAEEGDLVFVFSE